MKTNKQIFRGYDIRGIVDKDLSAEIAEHIGRAHGTLLVQKGINKAVVARDSRATSEEYTNAVAKGLSDCGIDVVDIGMVLVGTFYFAQYHLEAKGGVYVTASHNPSEYNGFKLANDFSSTLESLGIQSVRNMVEKEDYVASDKKGKIEKMDIMPVYTAEMQKRFNIKKKFKLVLDASHATAGAIVPELFRELGIEVVENKCNLDPTFPAGTPDPTEVVVAERLKAKILETNADIGISFDTDGDRIGVVGEAGQIVWNDVLLEIFAEYQLKKHKGAIIMYNLLCSKAVKETILKNGGKPFQWRVGHSFLKNKNKEVGAAFIGELSGHFFFSKDFYNHDDGIYSALTLIQYLSDTNQTIADVLSKLPKYISSPEIKIGCPDDKKIEVTAKISADAKKAFPDAEVVDDERAGDGVRLELKNSMFVVRYSQNGPYLTVKFEAKEQAEYEKLRDYINKLLHSYSEIDWSFGVNVESLDSE